MYACVIYIFFSMIILDSKEVVCVCAWNFCLAVTHRVELDISVPNPVPPVSSSNRVSVHRCWVHVLPEGTS